MREIVLLARYNLYFILFFPLVVFPQRFPDHKIDSLLTRGIAEIVKQEYNSAYETFSEIDSLNPNLPFGKTYLAAVLIAKSTDYAEDYNTNKINELLDSAKVKSEILLDQNESDLWNNYFIALTLGYRAYFKILTGNYLDAFVDGYKSVQYFERCMQIKPEFSEAYLALGTYKYWKSAKASSLNWLPFFNDNRKEGINLLEHAIRNSSYNKYLALNSLIWIYINEKDYVKAKEIAEMALNDFPGSRFFMWGLARAYEDIDKNKAIKTYKEIRNSLASEKHLTNINNVELLHKMAMLYHRQNNLTESLKLLTAIDDIKLDEDELERLEERLIRIESLRKEILNKLSDR